MSLFERIREEKARVAADPAVIQAAQAAQEAQRKWEQETEAYRKTEALVAKQKAKQEVALTAGFKNLLKVVGAREQLVEVKKAWGVGRIDMTPQQIPDVATMLGGWSHAHQSFETAPLPKVPGMGLALRHWFRDREEASITGFAGWSNSKGSYYSKHEVSLHAIVGFRESGLPFVATLYGHRRLCERDAWAHIYFYETAYVGSLKAEPPAECMIHNQPETIFPTDRKASKQILEEQLYRICDRGTSFLELEKQAKERIRNDEHLPGRLYNLASPSWHRRLYGFVLYYLHNPPG